MPLTLDGADGLVVSVVGGGGVTVVVGAGVTVVVGAGVTVVVGAGVTVVVGAGVTVVVGGGVVVVVVTTDPSSLIRCTRVSVFRIFWKTVSCSPVSTQDPDGLFSPESK